MSLEEKIREVIEPTPEDENIQKRSYRRFHRRLAIKRRRKIIEIYHGHFRYYPPVGYYDEESGHIKTPADSTRQKYLKKRAHRKVRYYKGDLSDGQMCNKLFDYLWELL